MLVICPWTDWLINLTVYSFQIVLYIFGLESSALQTNTTWLLCLKQCFSIILFSLFWSPSGPLCNIILTVKMLNSSNQPQHIFSLLSFLWVWNTDKDCPRRIHILYRWGFWDDRWQGDYSGIMRIKTMYYQYAGVRWGWRPRWDSYA